MEPTPAKPSKKRRRWLIVALVLVLVSIVTWRSWPRADMRLVGRWLRKSSGNPSFVVEWWTFSDDGRFSETSIFMAPDDMETTPKVEGLWCAMRGGFRLDRPAPSKGSALDRFWELWDRWRGTRGRRFQIVQLNESSLQVQQVVGGALQGLRMKFEKQTSQ
jgi:hypothetical protein